MILKGLFSWRISRELILGSLITFVSIIFRISRTMVLKKGTGHKLITEGKSRLAQKPDSVCKFADID